MAQVPRAEPSRPPRSLNVVRPPEARAFAAPVDWTGWYLTDEDDMGEGCEQGIIIHVLRSVLLELCRRRRALAGAFVGTDNFFAWVPSEPLVRVSPDVYLLEGPVPTPLPGVWETWRPGMKPPLIAFEIVSQDWKKDYQLNPDKYAQLGVRELVIFDPEAAARAVRGRVALQAYHRAQDGAFVCAYEGGGPARSEVLDAWVAAVADGPAYRLRLADDGDALHLVPTADEARFEAEAGQRAAEAAREAAEQARKAAEQARDAERHAREAAERELAALRRRLAALEPGGEPRGG